MKKIIYVVLMVLAIGVAIYLIFFSKIPFGSATKVNWKEAVPSNVSWVTVINNPNSLAATMDSVEYSESLKALSFIDELIFLKAIIDTFQVKEGVYKRYISREIYASYHLAGVGNMQPIVYVPTDFGYKKLVKKMGELKENSVSVDEEWEYKGLKLYGYTHFGSKRKIYFTIAGGNLIFSEVAFLLEDAVSAISDGNKSPLNGELNSVFSNKATGSDISLFFNFANSGLYLSTILSPDFMRELASLNTFARWAALDIYLNENGLFYTGNIYSDKQVGVAAYVGNLRNPTSVLPNNTAYYLSKNLEEILAKKTDLKPLSSWIDNTMVRFSTEMYDDNFDQYFHYLVSLKKKEDVIQMLNGLSSSEVEENNIQSFNAKGKNLFTSLLSMNEIPDNLFFCKLDDWLVVSVSQSSLGLIKDKYSRNEVLKKDLSYNELYEQLKEENSATIYFNVKNNKILLANAVSVYVKKDFDATYAALQNFNQGMTQFKKSANSTTVMGYLLHSETSSADNQLVWKATLNGKANKVQVVKTDKGNYMVLAQDTTHMLYALSTGGNVLWNKQLESPIVGTIYDAAFMANENRHYMFNTQKKIYRIDERGSDMSEFPINLPDSTSQPLIIFKNLKGKFMMFVQASNGNLHGYEVTGKPIAGFNPVGNLKPLKNKVRYFTESGKGYVAAFTEDNKMHLFGENGARAFNPVTIEDEFYSPFSVDNSIAPLKLKNISVTGKVHSITTKGQLNSAQLSFSHPIHFYVLKDIVRDKDPEIITAGENCVSVYSKVGEKIQTFCFEGDGKEYTYQFVDKEKINDHNYLIATSKNNCISYLIRLSDKMTQEDVVTIQTCGEIILSKLFDSPDTFLLSTGKGEIQVFRVQ